MRTEYRIVGRFVKDEKPHVIDRDPKWSKADAERRLQEIKQQEERAKKRGCYTSSVGLIGISTPYYSEYELVDLKIQSREVSAWT